MYLLCLPELLSGQSADIQLKSIVGFMACRCPDLCVYLLSVYLMALLSGQSADIQLKSIVSFMACRCPDYVPTVST